MLPQIMKEISTVYKNIRNGPKDPIPLFAYLFSVPIALLKF